MQAVTHFETGPVHTTTHRSTTAHHQNVGLPSLTMRVLALLALVGTAAAFVPSQPSPFGATT